jgi:hypothetical protein
VIATRAEGRLLALHGAAEAAAAGELDQDGVDQRLVLLMALDAVAARVFLVEEDGGANTVVLGAAIAAAFRSRIDARRQQQFEQLAVDGARWVDGERHRAPPAAAEALEGIDASAVDGTAVFISCRERSTRLNHQRFTLRAPGVPAMRAEEEEQAASAA